jgi:hypothetical protein
VEEVVFQALIRKIEIAAVSDHLAQLFGTAATKLGVVGIEAVIEMGGSMVDIQLGPCIMGV